MFSTAWKTWSGRILSRTVAPQAAEASSRPALHSCGFWFPTCMLECGHASFPGLDGVGWPASSLMTAGGPQAESAYTTAAAGRESGASAACVAEHHGKRLGRVCFFPGVDAWMVLLGHPPFSNHTGHPCVLSSSSFVVWDFSLTRTCPLCVLSCFSFSLSCPRGIQVDRAPHSECQIRYVKLSSLSFLVKSGDIPSSSSRALI